MARIKAVFWDNDGVLVDTEKLHYRATREILLPCGLELTEAQYAECFLACGRGAWHLAPKVREEDIPVLRQQRNALHMKFLEERVEVLPGVPEVLEALSGRLLMGVVTTASRDCFDAAHARSGLRPYFDFVLTREDYAEGKPAPDPYLAALRLSGSRPEECLAIEDSPRGVQSGAAAGLRCCALRTSFCKGLDFSAADWVLDDVRELPGVIASSL